MDLKQAFEVMSNCRIHLFHAGEAEMRLQNHLKNVEAALINGTDPKDLGGNDKAREAKIRLLTTEVRESLDAASNKKREAQLAYDLATMSADLLKWEIRQRESEKQ